MRAPAPKSDKIMILDYLTLKRSKAYRYRFITVLLVSTKTVSVASAQRLVTLLPTVRADTEKTIYGIIMTDW